MKESTDAKKARGRKILTRLERAYPDAKIALDFTTPIELPGGDDPVRAVHDERVNMVRPRCFAPTGRPPITPGSSRNAREGHPFDGFFRAKARSSWEWPAPSSISTRVRCREPRGARRASRGRDSRRPTSCSARVRRAGIAVDTTSFASPSGSGSPVRGLPWRSTTSSPRFCRVRPGRGPAISSRPTGGERARPASLLPICPFALSALAGQDATLTSIFVRTPGVPAVSPIPGKAQTPPGRCRMRVFL